MPPRLPGLTVDELADALGSAARARRVLRWMYAVPAVPATLPARIPGVAEGAWSALVAATAWRPPVVRERRVAVDGTTKYALAFGSADGRVFEDGRVFGDGRVFEDGRVLGEAVVETVRIPGRGRSTVCVSSQAGCTRRCVFCATQTLGFARHLRADEMVAQVMTARADAPAAAPVRNVVFMGMGEPMDNLDEVLRAVRVLTQTPAPQLRAQSVTVSTSGVAPGMRRFLRECPASLALSLNATTDELRTRLMPHGRVWPIAELVDVLREDAARNPRRECFVEYVLFADLNDADADADRLVRLLDGIGARINLIPHNPIATSDLRAPAPERVRTFQARIAARGRRAFIRWPRGSEIAAACGQLVLAKTAPGR